MRIMTWDAARIRRELRLGEDNVREFKQIEFIGSRLKSPSRDEFANEISAFANGEGGLLCCGVTDKGKVQGLSLDEIVTLDSVLVEICTDTIKPPVRISTYHIELEGKLLLVAQIPEGEALHESKGESYIRVGGSKRKLSGDERLRLSQRRGQTRFKSFDETTLSNTGFETLEESLWKPLLTIHGAANPRTALKKLALLAVDEAGVDRATVAGLLLCTNNPEQRIRGASITATLYRGTDRASEQIDAQEITGPLNRQISQALTFAARNMQVSARKDPARVNLPQYSDKALFEAVVNAVAHRDYSIQGSRIRLSMFDNRMELQSPGSLPNNLTIESMAERQSTRNEALTSVLARMAVGNVLGSQQRRYFMESRGDGVVIIQRETEALSGKIPEYRLIDDSDLCLTIPAAVHDQSPARVVITVGSGNQPLSGVDILALFPNRTWKRASSNEHGEAVVELHSTNLPMTVFAAAPGYEAYRERHWLPSRRALAVNLIAEPAGGAVIFPESTGFVPGLKGRLNPVLDTHDRTYLYASNIAINEGQQQPVHFVLGEDIRLTDADGKEASIRVIDMFGRSALVQYQPFTKAKV